MYQHRVCLRLYLYPLIVCITLGFTLSVSIITYEAVCYFWLECIPQQTNVCSDIKTFHSELNMNQRLFDSSCLAMHTIIFSFFFVSYWGYIESGIWITNARHVLRELTLAAFILNFVLQNIFDIIPIWNVFGICNIA